jgi:hypothetical protein
MGVKKQFVCRTGCPVIGVEDDNAVGSLGIVRHGSQKNAQYLHDACKTGDEIVWPSVREGVEFREGKKPILRMVASCNAYENTQSTM